VSATRETEVQEPAATGGRTLAVSHAFLDAGRVDRAQISARAGLIAAIPVAGMLALGTVLHSPSAAVTMGVGAMLTGVAWRAGNGPLIPPVGTMAGAAGALAAATLAGTLSGNWPWLHLIVLIGFCAAAGSAATLGRPGLVIGTQSIIAFIVFGRFPEDAARAFGLTGLVIAGGVAQTLFASLVAVPLAWRRQRDALATAYRLLVDLIPETLLAEIPSAAGPAAAFDAADQILRGPALFADPNREALGGLVREGRRIRLELIVFRTMAAQAQRTQPELARMADEQVHDALTRLRSLLELVVIAICGDGAALAELPGDEAALSEWGESRTPLESVALDERLAALIGQVTAAARLATALRPPARRLGVIPVGQPSLGLRRALRRVGYGLRRMRAGTNLQTAAGRHALRLAVVVPLTELLAQLLGLPRGYWAVVATATVLRPGFGATFTRGAERVLGTLVGVVVASFIAVAIDPSGWGVVAVVAVLSYFTYAVFPASFAWGTATMTGVIVFLLHAVAPDSGQIALDRGIDTAIGGAIGLITYALWPTWSALSAGPLLARLVDAQHAYMDGVLDDLSSGSRAQESRLRSLAREARIAFADAEASISLALSEPVHGDADPRQASTTLGALRRVVYAIHALRLELVDSDLGPLPVLAPLRSALSDALAQLSLSLRDGRASSSFPHLRRLHRELGHTDGVTLNPTLLVELDELVDATDTAAMTAGLEVP
jgi:uncharacterized membrane protein YccC